MEAMMKFSRTMLLMPKPWLIWIGLLVLINGITPLFFLPYPEAIAVLAAFLAGGIFQTIIFDAKGFVRLLGIGHIFWVPLVFWLWTRLDTAPIDLPFVYWIFSVMTLNSLSLIIDAVDVIRYVLGDRQPQLVLPD